MDPMLRREIDNYFIQERLQSGGMAVVYKAYDQHRKQLVAFKVLKENYADQPQIVLRFKREAEIAQRLTHPHIVPFYDFGEIDGTLYMVMQFMEGGSLSDRLHRTANVPLGKTALWLRQISGALDFAHSQGVIHRDLKPGNILLANDDTAYLSDFGIAKITEATQLTATGQGMPGTARYMSPEQARGDMRLDYRSDLYSFGVIAYLLATGRYPFTGSNDTAIAMQHVAAPPPLPSAVNPRLPTAVDGVLLRCLAKDPRQRFSSAAEFMTAFERAITGYADMMVIVDPDAANPLASTGAFAYAPTPTPSRPPTPLARPSRTPVTRPLFWIPALLVLAAAGVLLALWISGRNKTLSPEEIMLAAQATRNLELTQTAARMQILAQEQTATATVWTLTPTPPDSDQDGVPDALDACPLDAAKIAPGLCGCNVPDADSDGDGILDCQDACPGQGDAGYGLAASGCPLLSPTPTDTATWTPLPTNTPTWTPMPTDTATPTPKPTDTATATFTTLPPTPMPTLTPVPPTRPALPPAGLLGFADFSSTQGGFQLEITFSGGEALAASAPGFPAEFAITADGEFAFSQQAGAPALHLTMNSSMSRAGMTYASVLAVTVAEELVCLDLTRGGVREAGCSSSSATEIQQTVAQFVEFDQQLDPTSLTDVIYANFQQLPGETWQGEPVTPFQYTVDVAAYLRQSEELVPLVAQAAAMDEASARTTLLLLLTMTQSQLVLTQYVGVDGYLHRAVVDFNFTMNLNALTGATGAPLDLVAHLEVNLANFNQPLLISSPEGMRLLSDAEMQTLVNSISDGLLRSFGLSGYGY